MAKGSDRWFQRYAWLLLFAVGLPFVVFGVSALFFGLSLTNSPVGIPGGPDAVRSLTGVTWADTLAESSATVTLLRGISRVSGLAFLGFAVFVMVVASVPYRGGQRWAWFALWVVPAFMVGLLLHELEGDFVQMPVILLVLSLLGLLVPYRRFFPGRS